MVGGGKYSFSTFGVGGGGGGGAERQINLIMTMKHLPGIELNKIKNLMTARKFFFVKWITVFRKQKQFFLEIQSYLRGGGGGEQLGGDPVWPGGQVGLFTLMISMSEGESSNGTDGFG